MVLCKFHIIISIIIIMSCLAMRLARVCRLMLQTIGWRPPYPVTNSAMEAAVAANGAT